MAKPVRLLIFEGPGQVDRLRAAIVGRQWCVLVNVSEEEAADTWPPSQDSWRKREIASVALEGGTSAEEASDHFTIGDWEVSVSTDEVRSSQRSLTIRSPQLALGVNPGPLGEPPPALRRALVLDASWSHLTEFPDRERVRSTLAELLRATGGRLFFISDLPWDLATFSSVAAELGQTERAVAVPVRGSTSRKIGQARQILSDIESRDTVAIGLVPGRDERGLFQRLRSDFAAKAAAVRAHSSSSLSTGPGASRDEALETMGLWLPTHVLIAGGPLSEQVLLARHLEEAAGGSPVRVAVAGGEYRLPEFDLIRHGDGPRKSASETLKRGVASRTGLVVVAYGRNEDSVSLSAAGLPGAVAALLPRIRVSRRGKTPEQVVREVEMAFSSRGVPLPAVRFLG